MPDICNPTEFIQGLFRNFVVNTSKFTYNIFNGSWKSKTNYCKKYY